MKTCLRLLTMALLLSPGIALAQCTTSNATSCSCKDGTTDCDLLPDITVGRPPLLVQGSSGVIEYSQSGNGSNDGRLRISVSTPNIGFGPLELRATNIFVCGTDTFVGTAPSICPDMITYPRIIINQRIYHKNGNTMTYNDRPAGTMTYHPTHGHMHVDNWGIFSLRSDNGDPNPLNWPIIGTGAKLAFCLMDYGTCSTYNGHCVDSAGTTLTNGNFPNFGLGGGSFTCSPSTQGISSGYTDIYYQSLDGMWIDIPPGVCNGQYYIVAQIDPENYFVESNENNNVMVVPFTLTKQSAGPVVTASGPTTFCQGQSVTLTASPGTGYLWSNGETTQSINVTTAGSYSCTVSGSACSSGTSPVVVNVTSLNASATADLTSVCEGDQVHLNGSTSSSPSLGPSTFSTSTPVPIIDFAGGIATPVYSPITVSGVSPASLSSGTIVSVQVNLSHTYDGDIELWLKSPSGDSIRLSNRRGSSGDNYSNTIFTMSASGSISSGSAPFSGSYKPETSLNTLTGNVNGTWKFIVIDRAAQDVGTINNWNISVLNTEVFNYSWSSTPAGFTSNSQSPMTFPTVNTDYHLTISSSVTGCQGTSDVSITVKHGNITLLNPGSGGPGTPVVITGSGFTGTTGVTFNGVNAAAFNVNSDSEIVATVPSGASDGPICVLVNGCEWCSLGNFILAPSFALNVRAFIEGFYSGGGTQVAVTDPVGHPVVCDTVHLKLASVASGNPVVYTADGIMMTDGTVSFQVPASMQGSSFYIILTHRNSLETWSALPVLMNTNPVNYDFSNASGKSYGSMCRQLEPGVYGMYSGDVNKDGLIESSDYSDVENQSQLFLTGYVPTDLTGDWIVESADYSLIENNSQMFLFVSRP